VVSIFNRWGDKVWEGHPYDNTKVVWRGHNQGGQPLPAGTYYYVIDTKTKRYSGWVELIR
jgi:gliding motility-associated-like protein